MVTAPRVSGGEQAVQNLVDQLARDPNWNGGWYYDRGGVTATLAAMRLDTLSRYGFNEALAQSFPDPAVRGAGLLIGVDFGRPVAGKVVRALMAGGFLATEAGPSVVRLSPPLSVTEEDAAALVAAFPEAARAALEEDGA